MADFAHLKKLEVKQGATIEHTMTAIDGSPVLILTSATEKNKPYFNANLRGARKGSRALRTGTISADLIEDGRNNDMVLYSKHVIKGWKGVKDSSGKDVEFSQANCLEFLQALPTWLFDDIREAAGTVTNFTEEAIDDQTVSKNS